MEILRVHLKLLKKLNCRIKNRDRIRIKKNTQKFIVGENKFNLEDSKVDN